MCHLLKVMVGRMLHQVGSCLYIPLKQFSSSFYFFILPVGVPSPFLPKSSQSLTSVDWSRVNDIQQFISVLVKNHVIMSYWIIVRPTLFFMYIFSFIYKRQQFPNLLTTSVCQFLLSRCCKLSVIDINQRFTSRPA